MKIIIILILAAGSFGFFLPSSSLSLFKTPIFDLKGSVLKDTAEQFRKDEEKVFKAYGKQYQKDPKTFFELALKEKLHIDTPNKTMAFYKGHYLHEFRQPFVVFKDYNRNRVMSDYTERGKFSYAFNRINRNSENIAKLYKKYGKIALAIYKSEVDKNDNLNQHVHALLECHKCIYSKPNPTLLLDTIGANLLNLNHSFLTNTMGAQLKPLFCEHIIEEYTRPGKWNTDFDVNWLYSFWVRRHLEGNSAIIYKILTDISQ